MKSIKQRQAYIIHKSKQLDKETDAHRYTRRLARIMTYNLLLSEIEATAALRIMKGDEEE